MAHHESRPPFVEEEAVHRALYLAAHADVRIQIVHVSSPVSAELVRQEKLRGRPVTMEICPHHLLARPGRPRPARPLRRLRAGPARPRAGRAALVVRPGRHRRLPDLRPQRLHAGGEGGRLGGHLRRAARLPGDPGDGAGGARRGVPPARDAARRVRPLRLDQSGADRRPLPAQGHAAARLRRRHRDLRPRHRVGRRRAQPAVLEEPVVAVRRPRRCGRASCGRWCAARRSTRTARSSPSPASGRFLSCHDDYSLGGAPRAAAAG